MLDPVFAHCMPFKLHYLSGYFPSFLLPALEPFCLRFGRSANTWKEHSACSTKQTKSSGGYSPGTSLQPRTREGQYGDALWVAWL